MKHWRTIQGWLTRHEVAVLQELADGVDLVVNVGVWKGRSTAALAEVARLVIAVDHFRGSDELAHLANGDLPRLQEVAEENLAGFVNVDIWAMESMEAAEALEGEADLILLDAGHEEDEMAADIAAWWPKVAEGGYLVIHDYGEPAFPGVKRAVDDAGLGGTPAQTARRLYVVEKGGSGDDS